MIGWRDLSVDEAIDLELEQAGRVSWQMFCIEFFGFGLALMVRHKPGA